MPLAKHKLVNFNISDKSINLFEIPTGNPLLIDFDSSLKVLSAKYLDKSREKKIISNLVIKKLCALTTQTANVIAKI